MIAAFISEYGTTILYTILTAAVSALGTWIGSIYKKYVNDKTKQSVVETCVKAVEQMYDTLTGSEKYDKAIESITAMLEEKGITFTELEIKMLIESVCNDFATAVKAEIAAETETEEEEVLTDGGDSE